MRMTEQEYQNYQQRQAEFKQEGTKSNAGSQNDSKDMLPYGQVSPRGLQGKFGAFVQDEETEQVALARYLDMKGVKWFHVPNGGKRNIVVAKKLKAAGVKAGVPDIVIIENPPNFPTAPGAVIELKRIKGGVVSEEQEGWLQHFENQGWCCCVAKGAGAAIDFLREMGW